VEAYPRISTDTAIATIMYNKKQMSLIRGISRAILEHKHTGDLIICFKNGRVKDCRFTAEEQ